MPRKKQPDIEPGRVPLEDDEPTAQTPKAGGKKQGDRAKGGKQRKEEAPRSHHKKPGPSVDQVKGGLAVVGSLAQSFALTITQDKQTGRSPVERIALTEEELARASNVVGDQIVRFTPVARALTYLDVARKGSPLIREVTALAAPRLARFGLIPPALAKMLGVSDVDVQTGILYRQEQIARDKARRSAPPMRVPREPSGADERDRVIEHAESTDGLPSVGVPPEAYRARPPEGPVEPHAPRGRGMDSITEPPV